MKTRIVILLSVVLVILSCSKSKDLPIPATPDPQINPISPDPSIIYGVGIPIDIRGEIADNEVIKALSLIVYKNSSSTTDTAFYKTRLVDSISCTYNESWTPLAGDFSGSTNTYLLEIKIKHDDSSPSPALSFFQEIQVFK